jgi:hypothetical protein
MDDFDETFFDSDENPFDLASLLPRRTALDKDKQIADTKQKLWELSCELRRLLEGSGERQVLELFLGAYILARRSTSAKDDDKQIEHDAISRVPDHLKSMAIKMITEHNFTVHGELMAYREAHTKSAELLGLGIGLGAFALAIANDTVLRAVAVMAVIVATIGVAAIRNRSPNPILDEQRLAYISLLSYLSNPHGDMQYGQMDPLEKQSHVNKLFKRELIVAILWNARSSTSAKEDVSSIEQDAVLRVDIQRIEATTALDFLLSEKGLLQLLGELGLSCTCSILEDSVLTCTDAWDTIKSFRAKEVIFVGEYQPRTETRFSPAVQEAIEMLVDRSPVPILYVQDPKIADGGTTDEGVESSSTAVDELNTGGATNDLTVAAAGDSAGESDIVTSNDGSNNTAPVASYTCSYRSELEDVYLQIKMNPSNNLSFISDCWVTAGSNTDITNRNKVDKFSFKYVLADSFRGSVEDWRKSFLSLCRSDLQVYLILYP